ncbi:MAG TPA: cation:proton antiporter [bacterium (Candidatus Stahlbacteria)]|nr:cation:proton antiporter [Candidatus Stahlbacteria bacterium]
MNTLLSAGIIFLGALVMMKLSSRFRIPSVTAYIVFGLIIGPHIANLISSDIINASGLISNLALSFIAFSLGRSFTITQFQKIGMMVISISLGKVAGSLILVTVALWLMTGIPFAVALILGAISTATAPAVVVMVTRDYRARGPFTDTLLGVVAIDDAWCIILFAFCLAIAKGMIGTNGSGTKDIVWAFIELIGSLGLGIILGYLLSRFSRYIKSASEFLILTVGFIIINSGIAILFHFSVLLTNMVLGATLANLDRASDKFFETIHSFDYIFYLLFFVLAGAHLDIPRLLSLSLIGLIYILTRLPGGMIGSYLGAFVVKADSKIRRYLGLGLAPQAGVALGLALIAYNEIPQYSRIILTTIIVTTIVYELFGPILTRIALEKAGEITSVD